MTEQNPGWKQKILDALVSDLAVSIAKWVGLALMAYLAKLNWASIQARTSEAVVGYAVYFIIGLLAVIVFLQERQHWKLKKQIQDDKAAKPDVRDNLYFLFKSLEIISLKEKSEAYLFLKGFILNGGKEAVEVGAIEMKLGDDQTQFLNMPRITAKSDQTITVPPITQLLANGGNFTSAVWEVIVPKATALELLDRVNVNGTLWADFKVWLSKDRVHWPNVRSNESDYGHRETVKVIDHVVRIDELLHIKSLIHEASALWTKLSDSGILDRTKGTDAGTLSAIATRIVIAKEVVDSFPGVPKPN